ncbi:MAG: hypothetical protein AAB421_02385 [Patescibacteria group bacterium]
MKEISLLLGAAKSTVSVWVRDVVLSDSAQNRIRGLCTKGQLAAQETHYARTRQKEKEADIFAWAVLKNFSPDETTERVLCALLYMCEGSKLYNNRGNFAFMNSEPALIALFLNLLRRSFALDESKFRACIHLHGYHNARAQTKFWSEVTGISLKQFMRPYIKIESRQSLREGYQGCIQVVYNDKMIMRQVLAIGRGFLTKYGPIV